MANEAYKRELKQTIEDRFNEDELRELCAGLEIKYANLPGQGHDRKVRELVDYCDRHDRLNELVERCREERPNVTWPKIPTMPAPPPQQESIPSAPVPDNRSSWRQKIPIWGWGILAILGLFAAIALTVALSRGDELSPTAVPTQESRATEPIPTQLTATDTAVPTPTPIFPGLAVITVDNAPDLAETNRFAKGVIHHEIVAYDPDGDYLAIPSLDGMYLYNAETLIEEEFIPTERGHWTRYPAFSPSGELLAFTVDFVGADDELRVWDLPNSEFLSTPSVAEIESSVASLGFISDDLLAFGAYAKVWFWQTSSQQIVNSVEASDGWIGDMAFSPDGTLMAIGRDDGGVELWYVAGCAQNGTVVCERRNEPAELQHELSVEDVEFSPDGRYLASVSYDYNNLNDSSLQIWDVSACAAQTEGACATLVYHSQDDDITGILDIDFSPDNVLAASTLADNKVRLWQAGESGWSATYEQEIYGGNPDKVLFSPDGQTLLVLNSYYDTLFFLHPQEPSEVVQQNLAINEHWDPQSVALSLDGTTAVLGSYNRTIRVLSLAAGQFTATFEVPGDSVDSVSISPDGSMVVTEIGNNEHAYLWFTHDPTQYCKLARDLSVSAFSPDGRQVVGGSEGGELYIWSLDEIQSDCTQTAAAIEPSASITSSHVVSSITGITFSPNNRWVATGHANGTVWVWDVEGGELQAYNFSQGHNHGVNSVAFSPDGRWLASASVEETAEGERGTIRLWHFDSDTGNLETSDERLVLTGYTSAINSVAFSPDSRLIVSTSGDYQNQKDDAQIKPIGIWQVDTLDLINTIEKSGGVLYAAFSPDGTFILSQGFGLVRMWGVPQQE